MRKIPRRRFLQLLAAISASLATVLGTILGCQPKEEAELEEETPGLVETPEIEETPEPIEEQQQPTPEEKRHEFLDEHQAETVAAITVQIIPTDEDPGANEAGVTQYIDTLCAGSERRQRLYLEGIRMLDDLGADRFGSGKAFVDLTLEEQIELLRAIEETEFFRMVRADTFEGFYTNPISWDFIAYEGPPQFGGYRDYASCSF